MQNQTDPGEIKRHHFLFYIFKRDKEANPMPCDRAQPLLQRLKQVFSDNANEKKERD